MQRGLLDDTIDEVCPQNAGTAQGVVIDLPHWRSHRGSSHARRTIKATLIRAQPQPRDTSSDGVLGAQDV
jgi:hypothetical protein